MRAKLALVVGHKNKTERNRLSRYGETIRVGRFAAFFEGRSEQTIWDQLDWLLFSNFLSPHAFEALLHGRQPFPAFRRSFHHLFNTPHPFR